MNEDTPADKQLCTVCFTPEQLARVAFVCAGKAICAACYEQLRHGAAMIADYNADIDRRRKRKHG
jgi:hypothetical protein